MSDDKFEHAGFVIEIEQDQDPQNPRTEYDNFGKLICSHKRYTLGDKHDYKASDFHSWSELQQKIEDDNDVAVLLPVYMLDHSGLTINTTGFQCPWDSGQIGFIFCTNKQVAEEFKGDAEKAKQCLIGEIATYDQYLTGNVYGYIIRKPNEDRDGLTCEGDEVESCWGFFGHDYCVDAARECAEAARRYEDKQIIDTEQAALSLFN